MSLRWRHREARDARSAESVSSNRRNLISRRRYDMLTVVRFVGFDREQPTFSGYRKSLIIADHEGAIHRRTD
jgi:hypothetical protein